jgi:NAD(P)-dependent dehydrogenase (short-subunit alcohol dehydrogenase family)
VITILKDEGMTQFTVLITGTNRGLGLELTKQYATDGWQVLACCRAPNKADALQALAKAHHNITVLPLDVADFTQIDALAEKLKAQAVDVLINNAGVYPESSFESLNMEDWAFAFRVNSMAPFKMINAFKTHIANSALKKAVTLSSKMGSIDDNSGGGSYIYRSSKTAVNMVMKSLSIDLKPLGISVVTLHPGWVQTDMGGPNGLINTQTSVNGLRIVINSLTIENSGKFIAYDGKEIAW